MKPLSIEELKDLKVGDWVWVVIDNEEELCCHTSYYKLDKKIHHDTGIDSLSFTGVEEDPELALSIYGTEWLAYRNKEQAEARGETVDYELKYRALNQAVIEMCARLGDKAYIKDFYHIMRSSKLRRFEVLANEAERRLAELEGVNNEGSSNG